ncbi:MAG TPA: hypothetical protein V6C58_03590 [Allocoleopsis sp.]
MSGILTKEIIDIIENLTSNQEFEVRFAVLDATTKNKFIPTIDLESMITIHNFLINFACLYDIRNEYIKYYLNGARIVNVLEKDCKVHYFDFPLMKKTGYSYNVIKYPKKIIDIKDYNIRFSLSEEFFDKETSFSSTRLNFIRIRKRFSFYFYGMKIELSIFKELTIPDNFQSEKTTSKWEEKILKQKVKYDIEIECDFSREYIDICKFIVEFENIIAQILKILQNSENLMNLQSDSDIRKDYLKLLSKSKFSFLGCQPESLRESKILKNTKYAITIKLDGKRSLLFITRGNIYLIDSKFRINDTRIKVNEEIDQTIIDVEIYEDKIYCFDIIFYRKRDLRNDIEYNLINRLKYLKEVISVINNPRIIYKSYSVDEVENEQLSFDELSLKYLKKLQYYTKIKTDGLIFTPINSPYPISKNEDIPLKWKESVYNTIDFKIQKSDINQGFQKWFLYCSSDNIEKCNILFEYPDYPDIGITYVNEEVSRKFINGSVIEFYFDKNTEMFVPLKQRLDKVRGNFIDIAKDNFDLILHPFKFFDKNINNIDRIFHYTKRFIVDWYIKNKFHSLLDLEGNPKDLYKWVDLDIRKVEFCTSNKDSYSKAENVCEKIKNNPTSKNFNYTISSASTILKKNIRFNMILSLDHTNFYENKKSFDKVIKIINTKLEDNGIFITIVPSVVSDDENSIDKYSITKETFEEHLQLKMIADISLEEIYGKWKIYDNYLTNKEKKIVFSYKVIIFEK